MIQTKTFSITGMKCANCAATVTSALKKAKGVKEVSVSLESGSAEVTYDDSLTTPAAMQKCVQDAGFGMLI